MKKLFTLFALLGFLTSPAFADDPEGEADSTPTAASFCNDERAPKSVNGDEDTEKKQENEVEEN